MRRHEARQERPVRATGPISDENSKENAMTNSPAHAEETNAGGTKSFPRVVPAIVRILLGLMFLIFGLNGFLNFMPAPKDMPQEIMSVMGALMSAGYMKVVSGVEVIVAVLLLLNR